jgi:hypothetical protein
MDVCDGANVLRKLSNPALGTFNALEEVLLAHRLRAGLLTQLRCTHVSVRHRSICVRYMLGRRRRRILRGLRVVGVGLGQLRWAAGLVVVLHHHVSRSRMGARMCCAYASSIWV